MECVRCHGLMVLDRFVDPAASDRAEFIGWRCLLCGDIRDPVIAANRRVPVIRAPRAKRKRAA